MTSQKPVSRQPRWPTIPTPQRESPPIGCRPGFLHITHYGFVYFRVVEIHYTFLAVVFPVALIVYYLDGGGSVGNGFLYECDDVGLCFVLVALGIFCRGRLLSHDINGNVTHIVGVVKATRITIDTTAKELL